MDTKNNKPKIVIAAGLYPPDIGGPATYAQMIEETLPQYGFLVVIVPFNTVRELPKIVRHLVYIWKLLIAARSCNVIYALDPISVGIPALVISKILRKKLIVRLGGDYAWEQGRQRFGITESLDVYTDGEKKRSFAVRVLAYTQSFVVRNATVVIVPSVYLKNIVRTWKGVDAHSIVVIHSAVTSLRVQGERNDIRAQLHYTTPTVVSAGRLVPWKGFVALIDSVMELRRTTPTAQLIIVGDGPEEEALAAHIVKKNASSYIFLAGTLSKHELGNALLGADIFVLNTEYEGLSHQLLEVMQLGVPIVTTGVGGNPELIRDGVSGLLVPYNDHEKITEAMNRLIDSPELAARLTQNAKVRVQDFREEKVIEELVALLNQICKS